MLLEKDRLSRDGVGVGKTEASKLARVAYQNAAKGYDAQRPQEQAEQLRAFSTCLLSDAADM